MQPQYRGCEAAKMLVMAARSGEGGLKGFNEYHLLQALRLMASKPVGRPRLVRALGVGEASVKTMLRVLRESGAAARCGAAHCITEVGLRVVEAFSGLCVAGPSSVGFGGGLERVVVVLAPQLEPPKNVVEVYYIRDYLVARECRPVIVGGYWPPKTLRFPGIPEAMEEVLAGAVIGELEAGRCDLDVERAAVVVAPEHCATRAAAAVIEALADSCKVGGRPSR